MLRAATPALLQGIREFDANEKTNRLQVANGVELNS